MTPDYDYIIGFDFGHGETSVAMVDAGKVSEKDGTVTLTTKIKGAKSQNKVDYKFSEGDDELMSDG